MALADFQRYPLTFGPSPVHPLKRLTEHLGGAQIWAKREDCNAGLAYGGNKTRKLEYLVPDASPRAPTRWSRSAATSPTTPGRWPRSPRISVSTACWSRRSGSTGRTRVNDRVGNIMLSRIMGAEVRLDAAGFGIGFKESWEQALDDVRERGRHAVRHPGRCVRPPARRSRVRPLGR